jgi:hypothetical protein
MADCATQMPIYMPSADWVPSTGNTGSSGGDSVTVYMLEELLPLSFGPEHLHR